MYTKDQFTKDLKKALIDSEIKVTELSAMLGKTKATLSQQINGATFRYVDVVNILDMLGYEVIWRKRDENKN